MGSGDKNHHRRQIFVVIMKIFIIEPEMNRQRQLRTILASIGHKSADIETANDKKQALTLLRKKRFDVAFFVHALQFDGIEFLKEIRGSAGLTSMPVVMYSPEVSKDNIVKAVEAGAKTFLAYPFSVSDVEGVLKGAMGTKAS